MPFCAKSAFSYPQLAEKDQMIVDPWLSRLLRSPRLGRYLFLGGAVTALACSITGCEYIPESMFRLTSESRLPKWITLPPGLTRADVSITMTLYIVPWGTRAVFKVRDAKGKTLEKVYGKDECGALQLKSPPQGAPSRYPGYEVISIGGLTEIFEQRRPEDIMYVTDEPAIWSQYRTTGCG